MGQGIFKGTRTETRTGMVFEADPKTGQLVCTNPGRVVDAREDRIANLEAENLRLRAVLEDGCDLGLAPDECREALSKCKDRSD
jgi:hypothetical protein